MANIANNTYLFYGDKDEIVKCHKVLNDTYKDVGPFNSCVESETFIVHPEWICYIDDINPGVDDRFYMGTESRWYGNPDYWYNWVKTNFPKLSVAFRCEEPLLKIFHQIDPDNVLQDAIWVYGLAIPADDISKLPSEIRGCAYKYTDDTYNLSGTFDKDELFTSNFKPSDLPKSITVREYKTKLAYGKPIKVEDKLKVLDELLAGKI